ncbi:MAG TPA: FHA domain-containing protein [Isosphaeraceae bacterium]|jgi:pSer/pThr/pTyr-binding forkhead associated (FHA) protein|nr:FHA domain-containing protein [Isosphaeraceae bacterium]
MTTPDLPAIRLVALDDGPDVLLGGRLLVLGRHPSCDVRIDSIRVSRQHCCLTVLGGDLLVRDLGSTNGIRVNGRRVAAGRLRPGDELTIAHLRFRLERPAESREIPTLSAFEPGESGGQRPAASLQSVSCPHRSEADEAASPP